MPAPKAAETVRANANGNGTQSFDLRLRVFSKEHFHCPMCNAPLNLAALFNPPPQMAASQRGVPPAESRYWKLEDFAVEFCNDTGYRAADLKEKYRGPSFVRARRRFCEQASRAGFSSVEIGRWLGVHHTSVLNLLGRTRGAK